MELLKIFWFIIDLVYLPCLTWPLALSLALFSPRSCSPCRAAGRCTDEMPRTQSGWKHHRDYFQNRRKFVCSLSLGGSVAALWNDLAGHSLRCVDRNDICYPNDIWIKSEPADNCRAIAADDANILEYLEYSDSRLKKVSPIRNNADWQVSGHCAWTDF